MHGLHDRGARAPRPFAVGARAPGERTSATDSSHVNETLVQVADRPASGLHEQTGYHGVDHTSHTGHDHHGPELQCVPLVLPIAFSQRTGLEQKEAVEHTVPDQHFG